MSKIIQLTKAEEQVMHYLWELEECTVQGIREKFEDPQPARTTIATVLSVLESKGFVRHKTFGRVNVYSPIVSKEEYSKLRISDVLKSYFNNSFAAMATFFAKENKMSMEDLDKLLDETRQELSKEKENKQ